MVLFIIFLLVTIIFALLYRPTEPVHIPDAPKVYIKMEMSLSGIDPDEINVTLGDVIILNISSGDVQHTFALPNFGIFGLVVPARSTVFNVTIPANILGQHTYQCMEFSHDLAEEAGILRVDPRPPASPRAATTDLVDPPAVADIELSPQKRPQ